jgi:DNA-binding LacI/PurR family transcriptional regulator
VREREPFLEWFRDSRPDVVLVTDRLPYDWLVEAGFRVPRDVGVAMPGAVHNLPGAAGVDQDVRRIGLAAIEALVAQINRQETGAPRSPRTIMTEGSWVEGATVRKVGEPRPLAGLVDA